MAAYRKLSAWAARLPFARPDTEEGVRPPAPEAAPEGGVSRLAREGRRELLQAIADFLLENDLAVRPDTLAAAWEALSGSSPNLARRIEVRRRAGERITQAWLDEVTADPLGKADEEAPQRLLDEVDTALQHFARNTSAVRKVTSSYGSELDRHLSDLDRMKDGADVLSQIAGLAQSMAERTRKAEAELRTREKETRALRRRLDKARREAEHDHLTGLPNRRAFEVQLRRVYDEAKANGEPLSIAFCDLDHFKQVNDRHGHDAGDRVLKLVADELAAASADNCHVSRHGGEEFVLLFRNTTVREAKARLDATREALARRRLVNRDTDEPIGQITFSAGIADVFAYDDPRHALRAADAALLTAKENGRNQVIEAAANDAGGPPPR
jgi:diguanylate cyclase